MKKGILLSIFALAVMVMLTSETEDNNGKAGRTGSPGEVTCRDGCHSSYALNSGGGSITLTSDMINDEFVPGTTYNMQLTVTHSSLSLFGLGLEALTKTNANAGTLTAGAGNTTKTATVSGVSRRSITHTLNGGSGTSGTHTFNFTWKAPATGGDTVTFYFAGVAANGNNQNSLDYVYTGSHKFSERIVDTVSTDVQDLTMNVSAVNIYPNPTTDKLNINYTLSSSEIVEAGIYTLSGQLVQQVINGYRNQGINNEAIVLNENIRSSIYLLKITADNKSHAQKLVVQ